MGCGRGHGPISIFNRKARQAPAGLRGTNGLAGAFHLPLKTRPLHLHCSSRACTSVTFKERHVNIRTVSLDTVFWRGGCSGGPGRAYRDGDWDGGLAPPNFVLLGAPLKEQEREGAAVCGRAAPRTCSPSGPTSAPWP